MNQTNESNKLKILVVDDREENVYMLETLLKGSGYEVATAGNGAEALEKLKKDSIDIIISDILMPVMDGFRLCRECKKDGKLRNIPFIFYTATYTEKKDEEFALSLGAERFIRKPLEPEAFMNILEGLIKEYREKTFIAPKKPIREDEIYLAEYSKRIVKKLEDEMRHLNDANKKLKESEKKYSTLVEKGNDGIILIQDGLLKFANQKIIELTGFSNEEAIEKPFIDFVSDEHREFVGSRYKKRMLGEEPQSRYEIDILSKDGRKIPVEINASVIEYNKRPADMAIIRDITERRKAEKDLRRLNRSLKVLSECNQTIVHAGEESKLLRDICNNIVYFGGYRLAWVGFAGQDEDKTVRPAAQSGYESEYLNNINITWADTEQGRGPTGTAIRTGKPCICRNILTDPNYAPWRSEAVKRGYASSIALPLISESSVIGALNIYAVEPDAFDSEEVKLLTELANDTVYAITTLRTREERRKSEKALKESEEKFRKLMHAAPDAVIVSDLEGHITEASEQAIKMFGFGSIEEMIGKGTSELIAPEYREKAMMNLRDAVNGKELKRNTEYILMRKDKSLFTGEISAVLVKGAGGESKAFMVAIRDVTDRKRAEEALRESEEKFRNLAEQSPNMIFINKMGRVVYANTRCEEILGYKREEFYLPDFDFLTLIAPEHIDALKERFSRHKRGEEILPYEYSLLTKEGKRIESIITTKLINYEGSRAILGVVTDITDRKLAEESLRESEEKFRNLAEQSPNMIFIFMGGRIAYVNKRCEEITGFKREDFYAPGFSFPALTLPEHVKLIRENFSRQLGGEEVMPYEFAIIGKEGNRIDVILTPKVIKYDGEDSILGIITDITSLKRAEEKMKRTADELARANAEMETFVYSVAHDLRSPLRSMEGFSDALLEDYAKQMDPTAQDYARRIVAASRRMDTLIQNLLSYSHITRAEIEIKPTNMESVISEALEQMNLKIQESNASVVVEKPIPEVLGNRTILSQIVSNLLSNAVKFMAPGIKPKIKIRAEYYDNSVRLWVEDNGIGIEPEYQQRIFRLFERLHSAEEYPGTGIGLAIVAKGVERMGGKAGVESAPGKGSRFWIDLPAVNSE